MAGRPAGSRNKIKEKTLESFGMGKEKEDDMEKRVLQAVKELGEEFKERLEQIEKNIERQLKIQVEAAVKEVHERWELREEEWRAERQIWNKEKEEMQGRIKGLEWERERKKREERRTNIVIKGEEFEEGNIGEKVEEFVRKNLSIEIGVEKAYIAKGGGEGRKGKVVIAKLKNWDMKRQVMSRKRGLKRGIYIDDDLTEKERNIQRQARRRVKEERERGKEARVGYMKIKVGEKWLTWNEREEDFREEIRRGGKE